jgi:hypothetical protein
MHPSQPIFSKNHYYYYYYLRERGRWGDPDVDGRIILRWLFRKLEESWGLDGVGSG